MTTSVTSDHQRSASRERGETKTTQIANSNSQSLGALGDGYSEAPAAQLFRLRTPHRSGRRQAHPSKLLNLLHIGVQALDGGQ